jgi:PRTRC genetic system protein B
MLSNSGFLASSTPPQLNISAVMALTFSQVNDECIVAHHEITDNKMGIGQPIDPIEAAQLIDSLVDRKKGTSGWVDSRVVFESESKLIWYRQADKTPTSLWFRAGGKVPIEICAKLPTLIFIREKHTSSTTVLACTGSNRPTPQTKIYHAPIFNTGSTGAFCLGSATVPIGLIEPSEMISGTEDAIFNSTFTHSNQPLTFSKKHGDTINNKRHIEIWQRFAKEDARPLKQDLTPMGCTLGDIINKMEK